MSIAEAEIPTQVPVGRPAYSDYSYDQKTAAVAQYHANEGNLKRTAAELNIPVNTLRHWIESGIELRPQSLSDLGSKMEKTAHKLIEAIYSHDMEAAPLAAKATAYGIVFDKLQLFRGLPTSITLDTHREELLVVMQQAMQDVDLQALEVAGEVIPEPRVEP